MIEESQELGRLLRRAGRSAARAYRDRIADLQLGPRQAAAILVLVETPGLSLGALAEVIGADQPTASSLIDRLLAAGLVLRETDPADRRRARLEPTDRARLLAKRIAAARRDTEALMRNAMGPSDSIELERILTRLTERLDDMGVPGRRRERRA